MKEFVFKRKDNYSEKVLQRVRTIAAFNGDKGVGEGILFIPNKDCIKGYYKGLELFEKITDRCEKLNKRSPETVWDDHQDIILKVIGDGLHQDRERITQQIIALNNMTFSDDHYSVCGFETAISTLDVNVPGKKGAPEIDLAVYYRGLSLADIYTDKVKINKSFCKNSSCRAGFEIKHDLSLIEAIPYLKQNIDFKFTHSSGTYETEFSQLISRENNSQKLGNTTDYFILEEEYCINYQDNLSGDGRMDLVGVHINHCSANRTRKAIEQSKYGVVMIEVKYLENAYEDSKDTPGIAKHVSDFARLFDAQNQTVINDMAADFENIYLTKRQLGFLPGLRGENKSIHISNDPMDMELILALIGHNTNSKHLIEILEDIIEKYPEKITDRIFMAQTSEIGFGLYDDRMMTVREYVKRYR